MPIAKDDFELISQLTLDFDIIVQELTQWLKKEVIQKALRERVYDINLHVPGAEKSYERLKENGGLMGAWGFSGTEASFDEILGSVAGKVVSSVFFSYDGDNPDNPGGGALDVTPMTYNPDKYQHGSKASGDRSEGMPYYIEKGTNYDLLDEPTPRPFWDYVEAMLEDGTVDAEFEAIAFSHGIKLYKIG